MQRTIVQFSLLCLLAVAIGSAAASDVITYRDGKKATGQEQPGTIQDESITSVVIMPNLKNTPKTIDAADIINIVYEEPLKTKDAKDAYRKAVNAETAADRAGANAPNRKQLVAEALAEYQKALPKLAGVKFVERHVQYKIGVLAARLAADDAAQLPVAIDALAKFKAANPNSWQITNCIRVLAKLYSDTNDYEKAAATFEQLKGMNGLTKEMKLDAELQAINSWVLGGNMAKAGDLLRPLLASLPPTDPKFLELQMKQDLILAKSGKFKQAETELKGLIKDAKDKDKVALFHNTLGECYLVNNQPKDAVFEFLWVEMMYNQNKNEELKAVAQLEKVFKQLNRPDRAREYADKLDRMRR